VAKHILAHNGRDSRPTAKGTTILAAFPQGNGQTQEAEVIKLRELCGVATLDPLVECLEQTVQNLGGFANCLKHEADRTTRGLRKQIGIARTVVCKLRYEVTAFESRLAVLREGFRQPWSSIFPKWLEYSILCHSSLSTWLDEFDGVVERNLQNFAQLWERPPPPHVPDFLGRSEVDRLCRNAAREVQLLRKALARAAGSLRRMGLEQVSDSIPATSGRLQLKSR
jgi:hypothetical protein